MSRGVVHARSREAKFDAGSRRIAPSLIASGRLQHLSWYGRACTPITNCLPACPLVFTVLPERQRECEGRATARLAACGQGAVMGIDDCLADRQAKSDAAARPCPPGIHPVEPVEDPRQVL